MHSLRSEERDSFFKSEEGGRQTDRDVKRDTTQIASNTGVFVIHGINCECSFVGTKCNRPCYRRGIPDKCHSVFINPEVNVITECFFG